jgi:hypothetical protein
VDGTPPVPERDPVPVTDATAIGRAAIGAVGVFLLVLWAVFAYASWQQ